MTLGGFFLGLVLIGVGFVMVWKSRQLYQNVGDLAELFDASRLSSLFQWPVIGSIVMVAGMLVMFDLLGPMVRAIFLLFYSGR